MSDHLPFFLNLLRQCNFPPLHGPITVHHSLGFRGRKESFTHPLPVHSHLKRVKFPYQKEEIICQLVSFFELISLRTLNNTRFTTLLLFLLRSQQVVIPLSSLVDNLHFLNLLHSLFLGSFVFCLRRWGCFLFLMSCSV